MTKDPELAAQTRILAALKDLDPETLSRVVKWVGERFGQKPIPWGAMPQIDLLKAPFHDTRCILPNGPNVVSGAGPGHGPGLDLDTLASNPAGSVREPPKLGRDA